MSSSLSLVGSYVTGFVNWAFPTTIHQALQMTSQVDKAPRGPFSQFCQAFKAREQTTAELETLFKALESRDYIEAENAETILREIVDVTNDWAFFDLVRNSYDFRNLEWIEKDAFSSNDFVRRRSIIACGSYWKPGGVPILLGIATRKLDGNASEQIDGLICFQAAMGHSEFISSSTDLLKRGIEVAFSLLYQEKTRPISNRFFTHLFSRLRERELAIIAPFFTQGCKNPIKKTYDQGNSTFLVLLQEFLRARPTDEIVIDIFIQTLVKECQSGNVGRIGMALSYCKEVKKYKTAEEFKLILVQCQKLGDKADTEWGQEPQQPKKLQIAGADDEKE